MVKEHGLKVIEGGKPPTSSRRRPKIQLPNSFQGGGPLVELLRDFIMADAIDGLLQKEPDTFRNFPVAHAASFAQDLRQVEEHLRLIRQELEALPPPKG